MDRARMPSSRKWMLPTYTVYDWDQRTRFTFTGGMQAKPFLQRLDRIREGALSWMQDLEAWTAVANGYTKAGAAEEAGDAWQRVGRGAASRGDRATAPRKRWSG